MPITTNNHIYALILEPVPLQSTITYICPICDKIGLCEILTSDLFRCFVSFPNLEPIPAVGIMTRYVT